MTDEQEHAILSREALRKTHRMGQLHLEEERANKKRSTSSERVALAEENERLWRAVNAYREYMAIIPTAYKRTADDFRSRAREYRSAGRSERHAQLLDAVANALDALDAG